MGTRIPRLVFGHVGKFEVVVVDEMRLPQVVAALDLKNFTSVDIRRNWINFRILIRSVAAKILRPRFPLRSHYVATYSKSAGAKVVVTFNDNLQFFYATPHLNPDATFFAFQNGFRGRNDFLDWETPKWAPFVRRHATVFVHSSGHINRYQAAVPCHAVAAGSLANNASAKSTTARTRAIGFVSLFVDPAITYVGADSHSFVYKEMLHPDRNLLPLLAEWCERHDFELVVVPRSVNDPREKEYFCERFGDNRFRIYDRDSRSDVYQICDSMSAVVSTHSTLGLEAAGRGNPTAIFWTRPEALGPNFPHFGDPEKLAAKGPFWTDEISAEEVDRLLFHATNDNGFFEVHRSLIETLMPFDEGNRLAKQALAAALGSSAAPS